MSERTRWQTVARRIRVPTGFCFAALFLWLARPTWPTLATSVLLVLPGLWLRGYAAGYVNKSVELTVTGPYAYTRNPLYLGSMLIAFGFAAAARSIVIFALLAALFLLIYLPTIRSEEEFLRGAFPEFSAYAEQVPRLLPRVRTERRAARSAGFDRSRYLRHREYNAGMGALAIYAALIAKILWLGHR